jgi:hypothetical protein
VSFACKKSANGCIADRSATRSANVRAKNAERFSANQRCELCFFNSEPRTIQPPSDSYFSYPSGAFVRVVSPRGGARTKTGKNRRRSRLRRGRHMTDWTTRIRPDCTAPYGVEELHTVWFTPKGWPGKGTTISLLIPECEMHCSMLDRNGELLHIINCPPTNRNVKRWLRYVCELATQQASACSSPAILLVRLRSQHGAPQGCFPLLPPARARPGGHEVRRPAPRGDPSG